MDEAWKSQVARAHQWATEHAAVDEVSDLAMDPSSAHFTATFRVPLPSRFVTAGETRKGVKAREPVTFIFTDVFAFHAPLLRLRPDFPREFPHINPNVKEVSPCIFDGNLSELLQQPQWFDGLLDRMADWLAKAAADALMNMNQGWEPMRTDECHGILLNDWESLRRGAEKGMQENQRFYAACWPLGKGHLGLVLNPFHGAVDRKRILKAEHTAGIVMALPPGASSDRYLPCQVHDLSDLLRLGEIFGIAGLDESIKDLLRELKNAGKRIMFVVLAVRRPVHLIGSPYSSECISFALRWVTKTKKKRTKTKYFAEVLSNRDLCTPELLQRFSGTQNSDKHITLIGCGSLGSKIGLHLARGGQKMLALVDNGWLAPHNNARHAVTAHLWDSKVEAVSKELKKMRVTVEPHDKDARLHLASVPPESLVVDTTASQSVRSCIASQCPGARSIHCALYSDATYGLMCIEGLHHNPRVDDLVLAHLYWAMSYKHLHEVFFNENGQRTPTGQGCGSLTVVAPDTRMSLLAAAMAARVRQHTESPLGCGAVLVANASGNMSLTWDERHVEPSATISGVFDGKWEVRVLAQAETKMAEETESDVPNETGGVLVGHVSYTTRCMTVVDVLPAPPDSIKERHLFVLGTEGLKKSIQELEQASNGKFTYLGTWHSHPHGGGQSQTDKKTLVRITLLRNYEPTVCLIWTPSGILAVA